MLKMGKNVNKLKKVITILISIILIFGIYIKVEAIDLSQGTINPIYRPKWEKVSTTVDEGNKTISINLKGKASDTQTITDDLKINYSSTVTTSLSVNDILVYIDGELDGDTNKNGVLDTGETPSITKEVTPTGVIENLTEATHVLKLSGFEQTIRQTGRPFKDWSGNISIKILGRGEESSTYSANTLIDVFGNQSMMETDEVAGTWEDVIFEDGAVDRNTTGTMFSDFIKPEFTYTYTTTNPDINTGVESVTVVFDVTDKFFASTTLASDTNGNLITVIVDEDENADTPITKVLTKIKDVYYDATAGTTYVDPGETGTGKKVGERYQLVITGLDREDGFLYSGPMTLSFDSEIVLDTSGNKSDAKAITMGLNEPVPETDKPSDLFDANGTNPNGLHIGDFIEYNAGTWTQSEINAIQTGEKTSLVTANGTTTLPASNYQFGGFAAGTSRNGTVAGGYDYIKNAATNQHLTGWRVFDIEDDGTLVLISSGNPEYYRDGGASEVENIDYYILTGNVSPELSGSENQYQNRDWSNYINTKQKAESATVLTYNKLIDWYVKYLEIQEGVTSLNTEQIQKIYSEPYLNYQNVIDNYSRYWLSKPSTAVWKNFFSSDQRSIPSLNNQPFGLRILVSLSPNVELVAERIGTRTVTGGNTTTYGGNQTYNVWGIKEDEGIVVDVVDPIWQVQNQNMTTGADGNVSITMDLIGVDKYFKQSTLTNSDIKIKVNEIDDISLDADGNGVPDNAPDLVKTLGTVQYIKKDGSGNYVVTENIDEAIGVKYALSISQTKESDNTFFGNRTEYNADHTNGRPYREFSGEMSIVIPEGKLEDETGNVSNEFTIDFDHVDTLKPEVIKVSGTANTNASNNELSTYTVVFDIVDKYINSSAITTADTSMIHVYLDGEEAPSMTKPATEAEQNANSDKVFKEITNIEPLTGTVNGASRTVGYRYTLVLSGIEKPRTAIDYNREYTDWSGDLSIKIDANTARDTSNIGNDATIMYGNEIETQVKSSAVHIDYVKPDATYEFSSVQDGVSDVTDKNGKTYTMVFDITDKFFQTEDANANGELDEGEDTNSNGELDDGNNLSISDFTILMSAEEETETGEDGYYNLMTNALIGKALEKEDITNEVVVDVVNGNPVKETRVIGKRYTLRLSNLEQLQRIENNYYLDYSGSVTISIPAGKILDTSGNGNDVTVITSGIDIPGGEVSDISEIDVVQPLWERTGFTTDIHNKIATVTLLGTDKYFYEYDLVSGDEGYDADLENNGILKWDEIEIYVDGEKVDFSADDLLLSDVTKLYEERLVQTEYSDGDVDTGYTTEEVQYGVQYTITLKNFDIDKKQVKVRLAEGTLVDQSGNPNRLTEFLVYNTLTTAQDAEGNWEDMESATSFLGNANISRLDIQKIIFVEDLDDAPTIDTVRCWDVSAQKDNSILAWYNETSAPYTVYIGSNDQIYGNVNSSFLFCGIGAGENSTSTEVIRSINLLDTRNVTDMSYMFMGTGAIAMTELDLGDNFDTSNVTNMEGMFAACGAFAMTSFDLGDKFDTSKAINMSGMFNECGYQALTSLNLGGKFDTSSVTDMSYMFASCGYTAMTSLELGEKFDTSNVTNMQGMFRGCGYTAMTGLDLGEKFDTSNVTNMEEMLRECGYTAMTSLELGEKFDTSSVTNMQGMFLQCGYTVLTTLDLGDKFYTTSATNMANMFYECGNTAMTTLDLGPAFTRIASTNSNFINGTGKNGECVIFAPESIYSSRQYFKLDTNATTGTINLTRGTINPVYRPEWEKVSTSVDVDNKEITVTFKGYANETFSNGTFTGSYSSPITSLITAGNDASNLLVVKVDGEVAEGITQTITQVSETKNADNEVTEVQYTIKLSGFEETVRQSGKNFKEWSGNIAIQPIKGTLIDKYGSYIGTQTVTNADGSTSTVLVPVTNVFTDASGNYIGNKNMTVIDDSTGKWTDIELRDVTQEGSTDKTVSGNWTGLEDNNADAVTNGTMFTDYIKPEFTYRWAKTVINYINNKVTIEFDVTDKYFDSTTLTSDLITVIVDGEVIGDANENGILDEGERQQAPITKTLTKIEDLYYEVNGNANHKVGERYQLLIEGLEIEHGVGYSGIVTLAFPADVISDLSDNKNTAKTITVGIDEPQIELPPEVGYIPEGYYYVEGDLTTGFVVQDPQGNQYVWVEVPKTLTVYPTAGLGITEFTDEEYTKIENDLNTYTSAYTGDSTITDTNYSATGLTDEQYTTLKKKMLKSIYQHGGFYVGRYETGTTTARTADDKESINQTPVIKQNAYTYGIISTSEAQTLSSSFASDLDGYTSSLMFGVQWDLIMKYLETKGATQDELKVDSSSWGYYSENSLQIGFTLTTNMDKLRSELTQKSLGKLNTETYIVEWITLWDLHGLEGITSEDMEGIINETGLEEGDFFSIIVPQEELAGYGFIVTSGFTEEYNKQNIYDLAGNVAEYTLENYDGMDGAETVRGGSKISGSISANSRDEWNSSLFCFGMEGFRTVLIKDEYEEEEGNEQEEQVVDVVNPLWNYAVSDIDRVDNHDEVNIYIIGSDKFYKQNTLTTDEITVYVDNSSTTVDTDRDGTLDGNVTTITKTLTDITADMRDPSNAERLAELIEGAGLTDQIAGNYSDVGVIYKLTLSTFGTISGETKVVLDENTIEDTSGNKNRETTIEVGNVTWEESNEPLENGDAGYPRYPAFRNDIVDFIDPIITYTHSTVQVDTDGDGTPDTTVSENPDINYVDKIVTVKFQVTDKYLLESDLMETTTDGDGNTIQIPKNITLIVDGTTIYTNDGNDATTDTREVTTSISSTDIANGKEYTLVVKGLQKYEYPDNDGFTYSGPMQVVFTPGVIEDTSGNTNSAKTITLDTMYDDIVDVVDPIIKYVSSSINRSTGTVTLRLMAEDKYLSSETLRANINNVIVKIVDLDGAEIVNDSTTISKSISMTSTIEGGYRKFNYTITLTGFETEETIASKNRETDTLIKGITSIIIPADSLKDTSGNGNKETPILVGSPTDTTAFKDSIVDCVSPIWQYDTSSIDRDRYDNGISHNQTGTVTIDIIGTDKFFDNTYFTDSSKALTIDDIHVFVNNVENTTITKSLNTNADDSLFKEQLTRTLADGTTAPFGVKYRLLLSNFGTNDGAVRIEIDGDVIRDTSENPNASTPINAGNTEWVEDDEPLEEGAAGYPKYPAFRNNIADFINPVVTYTYSNVAGSENPILDRTDPDAEKLYIKFNVTDTNFLESNIGVNDLTIYADIDDGNGNSEMNITTLLNDRNAIQLSEPTSITNAGGAIIGKSYTITLSQFELADLLENEVFLRHSGRIRFVVAEGQVEDTSGNKNVETSLIVDYGDGTNTGTDEDDYVVVDFVDPIIKYQSKFINWNDRYATVTLRATDRFYDMTTKLEPSDLTLYELNEDGEWINITNQYYNPSAGINDLTITQTPVTNADGYQYGYDFIVKLDNFEEEFKLKLVVKADELMDDSENKNKTTEIEVDLDNRKPKWEYVSTVTTDFESTGTISFTVKGVDKFLDITNSKLEVIQEAEGVEASTDVRVLLDGIDITNIPNISISKIAEDLNNTDDGERSETYQINVSGLTQVGTYSLVFEKDTLVDEFNNKSAATTITFSKSSITGNTGNYTNITYHVSPDNNQVHSSFVHEMMSLNTTGTNFEDTPSATFKPSSIGELNNDGENPLFAEPMYREELEADGYTVKYVYAPKSFAGWAEADEDGNIITGGTTYGLYDDIPNTKVHLKAVWQDATVVFVSANDGDNSKDGKLPENAVQDMATAFDKLNASGTVENNIIVIMDAVEWNSGSTLTKTATITSLYAGVDYRKSANAELKITSNITTNADITFDNIKLYTNSTDVSDGTDYLANGTYSNMLIANYANVILGRRVTTPSGKYTFGAIIGGNYKTETTTGTIGTHTVRVEAGRYNNIIAGSAFATATTTTKTVTHEVVIGNMREAAISRNDRLTITGYVAMGELTGATNLYSQDYSKVTLYSGVFTGDKAFNKSSEDIAIYMRSLYGSVDGKVTFEMYGGEVNANIYAGSRTGTSYSSTIVNTMKFYGGTVVGNIFGQGANNAFTGSTEIILTGRINITGNVFGGSNVTVAGQGNGTGNTNITINSMSATVNGNIYGGSNGVSNSGYIEGNTNITVNAGTLTNIYGSGNNTGNSGDTNITINNGTVSGKIVGGAYKAQAGGTANITVVGGIVTGNIYGGNENTTQTELDNDSIEQSAAITIGTTDETITTIPTINGIIYAGGVFDAVGTTEVQLIEAQNTISAVYGGSNANAETTEANITLNGATVGVIYGGGNEAGTVDEANINLTTGTVTDVYGGGYAANVTTSNITLQGTATVESIYGGSNASATATGSVTTSNVILTSGNVTNAFGGGNSSGVGTANITLNGITIDELHGGSKDAGTVTTSNVTLTSGTVGTVFGGGLDSNVGTSNITHNGTAVVTTIYGGNNSGTGDGGTVGTSNIDIINTQVANVYGGNYLKGTTTTTNINIQGTSTITGKLFGGGYKSNIATSSVTGSTTINVTGGTINCDINGGSEQGVVYGTTNINIGKDAVATTLTNGNISIDGNIYGAGSSNLAINRKQTTDRTQYNYDYVSVVGSTNIVLDASLTTPITFSNSIYGAGNGATYSASPDTSRIFLKDLGSSTNAHQLISVERTGRLFIGNSFVELLGNADINNEYRKASYTLNRITDGLTVYDNSTVYTRRGFNKVGGFNSFTTISEVTGNGTKAAVTVTGGKVGTRNVDNRLYTFEGVNLIFSKQETYDYATATSDVWGEVNGMTFFGMYALDDSGNKVVDIYEPNTYNSDYSGTLIEKYFANGTFVEGLHETSHNIGIDGFYTVAADYEADTVNVEIIQPTPESATYYDWLIGADRVTYNVSLIGSIFGDEATAELELDYNYLPNATYTFDRVSLNALDLGVSLINPLDIDIVSDDANDTFGLTVETDAAGWLNRAQTNIYTQKGATDTTQQDNGSFAGDLIYNSDNTTTPGTIKFKMYNSLNITETKDLGFVNLQLTGRTTDPDDPSIGNTFIIVIAVNLQAEATEQIEDYVPKFTDTSATELNYTSDSKVDITYVLFKDMEVTPYLEGDYRVISTSTPLPEGTKLTLKDYGQGDNTKVYYYHVTNSTTYTTETVDGTTRYLYKLSDIFEMASTTAKYQDSTSYYHSEGYVLEKYDLSIDFLDSGIATNELAQETYLELRRSSGAQKYDNGEKEIKYNLYSTTVNGEGNTIDANAVFSEVLSNEGQTYSVIDTTEITFTLDVAIQEQLTATGERIMDTKHYDKYAGIALEVIDENGVRVILPDAQNVRLIDLDSGVEYLSDESGVIRVPIFEGLSSMSKNYKFTISQNSVPPGNCSVKLYFFTSDDGMHYGNEEKMEKEFYAIFINRLLGRLGVEATSDSRILSKETGLDLAGNAGIDMTLSIGDPTPNTNIRVKLYKRNATYDIDGNHTGTQYSLVNISNYLQGTWETPESYGLTSAGQYQYIMWAYPEEEPVAEGEEEEESNILVVDFEKLLKEDIDTGEYKVVFESYHDDILVQTVRKTFIVTQ